MNTKIVLFLHAVTPPYRKTRSVLWHNEKKAYYLNITDHIDGRERYRELFKIKFPFVFSGSDKNIDIIPFLHFITVILKERWYYIDIYM